MVANVSVLKNIFFFFMGVATTEFSPLALHDALQIFTYTVTAVPLATFGKIYLADGVTVVAAATSHTLVQLHGMQFMPPAEAPGGPVTLSWKAKEHSGVPNGGIDTLTEALTIPITPAN